MSTAELLEQSLYRPFLLSPEPLRYLRQSLATHGLDGGRAKELLVLASAVINGEIEIGEMSDLIASAFECSHEVANDIARDVIGYRLLPLKDVVPGVAEALVAAGGDAAKYPTLSRYREPRSALAWAKEIVEDHKLPFTDVLQKRLALFLEQRSREEKTAADLVTFFGRPLAIGGLALEKGVIDSLIDGIERDALKYRLVSEDEWQKIEAENEIEEDDPWAEADEDEKGELESPAVAAVPPAEGAVTDPVQTTEVEIAPSHELAVEVPVINAPKKIEEEFVPTEDDAIRARVARRSAESVAAIFADAVDAMTEDVAKIFAQHAGIDRRAVVDVLLQALRGAKEEGVVIDRLQSRFGFSKQEIDTALLALNKAKKIFAQAHDGAATLRPEVVAAVEETEIRLLDRRFGTRVDDAEVKATAPKPVKVELTVGSVAAQAMGKVTDVRPGKRLMGPIEQLGAMTPQDFRRLGATPDAGVQKIEELLASLTATGVDERVRGIKALRESPLMRLYALIARDALMKRMSVAEAAAARRKDGQESLGPQEVKALLGLQGKLSA